MHEVSLYLSILVYLSSPRGRADDGVSTAGGCGWTRMVVWVFTQPYDGECVATPLMGSSLWCEHPAERDVGIHNSFRFAFH